MSLYLRGHDTICMITASQVIDQDLFVICLTFTEIKARIFEFPLFSGCTDILNIRLQRALFEQVHSLP